MNSAELILPNDTLPGQFENSIMGDAGMNPDCHTADLLTAVQYGYFDRVVELIDSNPQLTATPLNDNITLLHWAAINNRIEIAEYLINKGAPIDAVGGVLNGSPLHWAIREGKIEMMIFLLSHNARASLVDNEGLSCIHLASMFGHTAMIAYLAAKGHDFELLDKIGRTPLMLAAFHTKNRDPTQLLVRLGASVNYQNPINKNTALHYAVSGNNMEVIRTLVRCGAKTSIRNTDNEDVYEFAAKSNATRPLIMLLARLTFSNSDLPKCCHVDRSIRRLGTKLLPYIIFITIGLLVEFTGSLLFKGVLALVLLVFLYGIGMIFFDENVNRYLPIAIAQASIFCLYAYYFYYYLPYVHVASFSFVGLMICTYFSWRNFYLAQKTDPGFVVCNREQQNRIIIQLIEQKLFDSETYCTWCLTRRPLRSKHCRECGRCVARFDHHCPWIDNCVGDRNLRYFVGFVFFTPLCLGFYLYGAYLYFYHHCKIFASEPLTHVFSCAPAATWFTSLAALHILWISGLCITILAQIGGGFTTNERMNFWRYKYLYSATSTPFSLGWIQNFVDLINRRMFWYIPINVDWTRIYTFEDFNQSIPIKLRRATPSQLDV